MTDKYVGIVLTYLDPIYPEFYLIPEEDVTDELHEALAEQSRDYPFWCTEDKEDEREYRKERGEEQLYDLKKAIPFKMSPHDNEHEPSRLISRWYGFIIN